MGEGNRPTAGSQSSTVQRTAWVIGGTAVVLIAGLVLMQTFRAQPGQAAAESAGTAKLSNMQARPMARVGREDILYDMLAEECVARYGKEVLDDLINRMIIQQACEARGISVSEEEVTAEVNRIAKRFNLDPAAWYQMLQAERNITPMQYRQSVIWPMLALKKLAGDQVDITEEEMNKAFVRNYGPRVKARMILIDNLRHAQECWAECTKTPDEFEKLAQKYSIDPNSRALGGTIPPIPRYSGNDALEVAAFKLQPGEISGIVEIQSGRYAILKCEGRTEPVTNNIEEVRDSLYEELFESRTQQSVAEVFKKLKDNAKVDNFLTQTSTGPDRPFTAPTPGAIQQTSAQQKPSATNVRPAAAPGTATIKR